MPLVSINTFRLFSFPRLYLHPPGPRNLAPSTLMCSLICSSLEYTEVVSELLIPYPCEKKTCRPEFSVCLQFFSVKIKFTQSKMHRSKCIFPCLIDANSLVIHFPVKTQTISITLKSSLLSRGDHFSYFFHHTLVSPVSFACSRTSHKGN